MDDKRQKNQLEEPARRGRIVGGKARDRKPGYCRTVDGGGLRAAKFKLKVNQQKSAAPKPVLRFKERVRELDAPDQGCKHRTDGRRSGPVCEGLAWLFWEMKRLRCCRVLRSGPGADYGL